MGPLGWAWEPEKLPLEALGCLVLGLATREVVREALDAMETRRAISEYEINMCICCYDVYVHLVSRPPAPLPVSSRQGDFRHGGSIVNGE